MSSLLFFAPLLPMQSSLIITRTKADGQGTLYGMREGEYVLGNADPNSQGSSTMSVVLQEVIHTCDLLTIYRATLDTGGDVILKISSEMDILHQEANNYRTILRPLQGDVVPKYYSIFKGRIDYGGWSACLVLEYCGENLLLMFEDMPQTKR